MATLSGNPLSISAADVAAAALVAWVGQIHIRQIEFEGFFADGDTCDILDTAGRVVWHGDGAADKQTVRSGHIGTINGIQFAQGSITNGFVRIYYK